MRGDSKASLATAIVFFLLLFLPLLGKAVPAFDLTREINEQRRLAAAPHFERKSISAFPARYEAYFNDHFGSRSLLIHLNNRARLAVFKVSGSPKVLAGRQDWLYYTGDRMIDDYRGLNQLTAEDLNHWQQVLQGKQDWLAAQGIEYLFVIAPNKASVYPEHLPRGVRKVRDESPLDQLVAHLRRHSGVNFVDLRDPIRAHKQDGALFHRLDSHWTSQGAFLAYEQIAARVAARFPSVTPLTADELDHAVWRRQGGDLATMLGLQNNLKEAVPGWSIAVPAAAKAGKPGDARTPFAMEVAQGDLPRAIMFRDSFGTALVPFLAEDFSHVTFVWERWTQETPIERLLDEERPDIVIEEMVERMILDLALVSFDRQPAVEATYPRRLFGFGDTLGGSLDFQPVKHVELVVGESTLQVTSAGNDPHFLLPAFDFAGQGNVQVTLRFTSPARTSQQLFYRTDDDPVFDEKKSVRVATEQGANRITIPLAAPGLAGRLRIDPGSLPGEYLFSLIQVQGR